MISPALALAVDMIENDSNAIRRAAADADGVAVYEMINGHGTAP